MAVSYLFACFVWHPRCPWSWWLRRIDAAWSFSGVYGRPHYFVTSTSDNLRYHWHCAGLVCLLPSWEKTICTVQRFQFYSIDHLCYFVEYRKAQGSVIGRPNWTHWRNGPASTPLCGRYTGLRILCSWWSFCSSAAHLHLCHPNIRVDEGESSATEHCKVWTAVVYVASPAESSTQHALHLGCDIVQPVSCVRNLGIFIDSDVSMKTHISKTVSSCRRLRSIRRSDSQAVLLSLVTSLIMTRLDYGSAVLAGLPTHLLNRLQSVLNAAARLVCHLPRDLHWLWVPEIIQFRLPVLALCCRNHKPPSAPSYLADELHWTHQAESRHRLLFYGPVPVHAWSFREPGSAPSATDHFVWLSHVHGTVLLPA